MEIFKTYSLKPHNTFGLSPTANTAAIINSEQELAEILKTNIDKQILVLGEGSNILFTSLFVDALVIINRIAKIKVIEKNKNEVVVEAGSGVLWDDLVKYCVKNNFGGIENLSLIPGTVGAAPIQNIGAYGQELKDHFESLTAVKISSGKKIQLNKDECKFGYRDSIFKKELKSKVIVTSVKLKLKTNPKINIVYGTVAKELETLGILNPTIADESNVIRKIKSDKLPDPKIFGNAGSFFKNPVTTKDYYESLKKDFSDIVGYPENENHIKIPAAYLIEKCNLKDFKVGNVGTYPAQPLVIVNYGNATGKEIFEFSQMIKQKVFEKFQIQLEEEVNII